MTMDELTELNALVARARRHLRDYDQSAQASDYWQYHELYMELRDGWNMQLPPFLGKRPGGLSKPLNPV